MIRARVTLKVKDINSDNEFTISFIECYNEANTTSDVMRIISERIR